MAGQKVVRLNVPVAEARFRAAKAWAAALGMRWESVVAEALDLWTRAAESRSGTKGFASRGDIDPRRRHP